MLRILFVIPYLEVEQSVKQVFQEVASLKEEEISYDIRLAEIGGHLDIENDAADIIIARGFTAASIKTRHDESCKKMHPHISLRKDCFYRDYKYDFRC